MELAKGRGRDNKMTRKDTLIFLFVNGKREPYHDNPPTFSFLTLLFCHHNTPSPSCNFSANLRGRGRLRQSCHVSHSPSLFISRWRGRRVNTCQSMEVGKTNNHSHSFPF
jgi:hypothetical protein